MIEDSFFEALAHYASGMAAMSFCVWAVTLYKWRNRNRMIYLLFLCVAYIAISFLKDTIFLIPLQLFPAERVVENMVSIFDLGFVPPVCAFFIEATRPGSVTNRRLLAGFLPFMALFMLYGVTQANWVVTVSFVLAALFAVVTLVAVPMNVVRYNKYLSDNYSYTKNIGVGWCTGCAFGFFLLLAFYEVCFYEPTWFTEMTYDASFVVVWNIVCLKSRRHRVVVDMIAFDSATSADEATGTPAPQPAIEVAAKPVAAAAMSADATAAPEQPSADSDTEKYAFIADALRQCMEVDKLYLNTRLSLADLAVAASTNKTYVSIYINSQGCTFYDYINRYRVEEACRIIDHMATGERLTMSDVASRSGFNSVSSFNRYFFKVKGITPTAYLRSL